MRYSLNFCEGVKGAACWKLMGHRKRSRLPRSDDRNDGWRSDSLRAYNTLHACGMAKEGPETRATRKALWKIFLLQKKTRERFQGSQWRNRVSFWWRHWPGMALLLVLQAKYTKCDINLSRMSRESSDSGWWSTTHCELSWGCGDIF